MRTSRLASGLTTATLLALSAVGLSGCGPDYAIFDVSIHFPQISSPNDRQSVEECRITIKENGEDVLKDFLLGPPVYNAGGESLQSGCAGGMTPRIVGHFNYSTSRTSGTLSFTVNALDNARNVVHSGSKDGLVQKFPPMIPVDIELLKQ